MKKSELESSKERAILTSRNQARELECEIDDPCIFDCCTFDEEFEYSGTKVFVNAKSYKKYLDFLTCFGL